MAECIKFRSVLPFDENVKEEFISVIWGGAIYCWRGNITPDVKTRIELEIATFSGRGLYGVSLFRVASGL